MIYIIFWHPLNRFLKKSPFLYRMLNWFIVMLNKTIQHVDMISFRKDLRIHYSCLFVACCMYLHNHNSLTWDRRTCLCRGPQMSWPYNSSYVLILHTRLRRALCTVRLFVCTVVNDLLKLYTSTSYVEHFSSFKAGNRTLSHSQGVSMELPWNVINTRAIKNGHNSMPIRYLRQQKIWSFAYI